MDDSSWAWSSWGSGLWLHVIERLALIQAQLRTLTRQLVEWVELLWTKSQFISGVRLFTKFISPIIPSSWLRSHLIQSCSFGVSRLGQVAHKSRGHSFSNLKDSDRHTSSEHCWAVFFVLSLEYFTLGQNVYLFIVRSEFLVTIETTQWDKRAKRARPCKMLI